MPVDKISPSHQAIYCRISDSEHFRKELEGTPKIYRLHWSDGTSRKRLTVTSSCCRQVAVARVIRGNVGVSLLQDATNP
jgi:hypothetical protein